MTGSSKPSDPVNLGFIGSPQQIEAAFQAAGWTYGDSVSTLSVLREMRAMTSLNSYAHLPISRQWLNGAPPEFRFQKSFDSYEKREHIRIWNENTLQDGLWAGGAIRETSARVVPPEGEIYPPRRCGRGRGTRKDRAGTPAHGMCRACLLLADAGRVQNRCARRAETCFRPMAAWRL